MANFSAVAEAAKPSNIRKYLGTVTTVNGTRMVVIGDRTLYASWADPMVVDDGDTVEVEVKSGAEGQGQVKVTARSTTQPRVRTGKVTAVPAASPTINIEAGGVDYEAEFIGTYAVNDIVHLDWGAGRPRAIGRVTQTPGQQVMTSAPTVGTAPVDLASGTADASAIGSNTWWGPGGWGSWAGGRENVHQGDYGSGPLTGAWFYGAKLAALAGKTITRVRFRTGKRRPVGASSAPLTFHFYTHNSPSQPGGNVTLVDGPHDVVINPGQGPTTIDLPANFGGTLVSGGGIVIFGNNYGGMDGRLLQADSGALILDWHD